MKKQLLSEKKLFLCDWSLCKHFLVQQDAEQALPCRQEQAGACSAGAGVGTRLSIPALERETSLVFYFILFLKFYFFLKKIFIIIIITTQLQQVLKEV